MKRKDESFYTNIWDLNDPSNTMALMKGNSCQILTIRTTEEIKGKQKVVEVSMGSKGVEHLIKKLETVLPILKESTKLKNPNLSQIIGDKPEET